MKTETMTTVIRSCGKLIRTTTTTIVEPDEVDFADILAAVEIEPDDGMSSAPWEWSDMYEHEARPIGHGREIDSEGCCWDSGKRRRVVITMPWDDGEEKWYRDNGASRQVAREMVALSMRRRIDQLVKWYENGWEWWFCACEFKGCSASVGGIEDHDYASGECSTDVAMEITVQLEKDGYEVIGKPEVIRPKWTGHGVNLFSWRD